jgi:hypothetical protein
LGDDFNRDITSRRPQQLKRSRWCEGMALDPQASGTAKGYSAGGGPEGLDCTERILAVDVGPVVQHAQKVEVLIRPFAHPCRLLSQADRDEVHWPFSSPLDAVAVNCEGVQTTS